MASPNTIVNADINASAAITNTMIAGTAVTLADSGTVTSAMIADSTIVDGDISSSGHITASGDISGSGTIIGNKGVIGRATPVTNMELTVEGDISSSGTLHISTINDANDAGASSNLTIEDQHKVISEIKIFYKL